MEALARTLVNRQSHVAAAAAQERCRAIMSKDNKPEVGKVTKLPDGRDMTLVEYEEEDGDSFTWIVE